MQSFDSFVHNPEVQAQTKLQQKHEYGFFNFQMRIAILNPMVTIAVLKMARFMITSKRGGLRRGSGDQGSKTCGILDPRSPNAILWQINKKHCYETPHARSTKKYLGHITPHC